MEVENVTKRYAHRGGFVTALDGVDFRIGPGEFHAITGHSGSGKSTLLHLLGLMDAPDSGRVLVAGHDVSRLDDTARAALRLTRMGFIFQDYHLIPTLDAARNVALPMETLGKSRDDALARADTLLHEVGLAARADHLPHELSGGEQQRVAVARALANAPALLLADEPTGNLDDAAAESVMGLITRANKKDRVAVVLVTHQHGFIPPDATRTQFANGRVAAPKVARDVHA